MLARQIDAFAELGQPALSPETCRELGLQAAKARSLGSPFVGQVLEAACRQLARAPRLAGRIDRWSGHFSNDAVAMRLNAGLHALARQGTIPELQRLYRERDGDFDRAVGIALEQGEDELLHWLDAPTQTNEVGRSSAFLAALLALNARDPRPIELLEIGASAGLNLNLARYRHILGGGVFGDPASPLTIAPRWTGTPPPRARVEITTTRGVDLRPVRVADPAARERMMAFVWADRDDRAARLAGALAIAQAHPPQVDQGEALDWLPRELARAQLPGTRRVVANSMIAQYLPAPERRGLIAALLRAGSQATRERPLAWIELEWTHDRREVQLNLTDWSGESGEGRRTTLAVCHPYGDCIDWRMAG